jgi:hypothetical protein
MRLGWRSRAVGWIASAGIATACAPPPGASPDVGVTIPDANVRPDAARRDAGSPPTVLDLVVRDAAGPVTGATVVVDDANGQRETGVTASGGRATISNVGWGGGRITITVAAVGHPLASLVGFTRSDLASRTDTTGAVTFVIEAYYSPVGVSGHVLNQADASRPVYLYPDVSGQLDVTGTSFAGSIARGTPFHVYAIDVVYTRISTFHYTELPVSFVRVDHAAITSGTTFDVDMSASLPLTTLRGNLVLPPDGNPTQGGLARVRFSSDETYGRALLGYASEIDVAADGTSFDFTVSRLETVDTTAPVTQYGYETTQLYSDVWTDGAPTASPPVTSADFPMPPTFATPPSGGTAGFHDPITITGVDPMLPVRVSLAGTYTEWIFDLPAGSGALTIPAQPDGTDTTNWTGLTLTADACEPWAGHHLGCRRSAGGDQIGVTFP